MKLPKEQQAAQNAKKKPAAAAAWQSDRHKNNKSKHAEGKLQQPL